jgi:hypothetical protein
VRSAKLFLPRFTSHPALPRPPAPQEVPTVRSPAAFGSPVSYVRLRRDSVPHLHSRGIDWFLDPRENIPSDHPSRIGPGKQASRRPAAIQSSVAPSFSKADIMTSQAALFVNPCPTSKERLAHSHGRLQPADFRNSAMDVRDEPREVAMCSFTAAE